MITIFNRKELAVTMSMNTQAEIRDALRANGIQYYIKTTNLQNGSGFSSRRSNVGSFGMNTAFSYEYKIYVHKKDFEKAKHLIAK